MAPGIVTRVWCDDEGGQTAAEYLGLWAIAAFVVLGLALGGGGDRVGATVRATVCGLVGECPESEPAGSQTGDDRLEIGRRWILDHIAGLEAEREALLGGARPGQIAGPLAWRPTIGGLSRALDQTLDFPDVPLSRRAALADLDRRIARYRRWVSEARRLLAFDPEGLVVEVLGDVPLDEAGHVVVLVPGVWNDLGNYEESLRRHASNLHAAATDLAGPNVATVVWLGYDPPDAALTWGSATGSAADSAGDDLAGLVAWLDTIGGREQHQTLIGHSYGSLVVAEALEEGAAVDDAVLIGSPGVRRDAVADLDTDAAVWAARTDRDGIRFVPNMRVGPLGHGRDPTDPAFGARPFATGGATGHSGYFTPETAALSNLAAIVTGRDHEVVR